MRELKKPKISFKLISFSGDKTKFKNFMNAMISDYLNSPNNSDNLPNIEPQSSVEKAEKVPAGA